MKQLVDKLRNGQPVTLAFLGDSVTQGCFEIAYSREGELDAAFRQNQSYSHKLRRILSYLYPKASVNVLNYGVSGEMAEMGLKRVDDMMTHHPDMVVVCFGLNDSMRGFEGIEEYECSLKAIFDKMLETNVIFMTPNRMAENADPFIADNRVFDLVEEMSKIQKDGIMDAYMECARNVCQKKGIPICDCYKIWGRLKENGVKTQDLLANGINHPTEQMHWLFAVELARTIIE